MASAQLNCYKLVEKVPLNWIACGSVTELEVLLNWMKLNNHFQKRLIKFHPVQ